MSDIATAAPSVTTEISQDPSAPEGTFFWYELLTSDPDAAIDFYTQVVGWTAADFPNPSEMGDFRYTILSTGGRRVAGLMALTDAMKANGAQPGWLGVIHVADVDAATQRIAAAGGTIHKAPADIPTVGRFSVVADHGGAVFELLAPLPMEPEAPPLERTATGQVGWHEFYSSIGEQAAFDFYARLFGWQTDTAMDMGEMGMYRIFAKDGTRLGGMMNKPAPLPVSVWTFYINVDAIDAAVERVKAKGGQIVTGPVEVSGGSWIVQGIDPQGAYFALIAPKR